MGDLDDLAKMLRPAFGGVYTVSSGAREQKRVQHAIYGVEQDDELESRWREVLARIGDAEIVLLAVPSDAGAGLVRGTAYGPAAIRRHLVRRGSWLYRDRRVVDIGDVRVVPQILHDEMLSEAQIRETARGLYGDDAAGLPVSPLSITERALGIVRRLGPNAVPLVIGGDHSIGWPVAVAAQSGREGPMGILHFDAHTDLLERRLGVKYCFATWAHHANELIGRRMRLNQVGIRISSRTRAHWESTGELRQFWMSEVNQRRAEDIADEVIANFKASGVAGVYLSNDIDGTDPSCAAATGAPEPGGLAPETVEKLIARVGAAFPVWAADLMEVAPSVGLHDAREPDRTLRIAARYLEAEARVILDHAERRPFR